MDNLPYPINTVTGRRIDNDLYIPAVYGDMNASPMQIAVWCYHCGNLDAHDYAHWIPTYITTPYDAAY